MILFKEASSPVPLPFGTCQAQTCLLCGHVLPLYNQPQEQCPALSRSPTAMPRTAQPNQEAQEPTPYTPPGRPRALVSVHSHTYPTVYKMVTRWPGPEMRQGVDHREQRHSQSSNRSPVQSISGGVQNNPKTHLCEHLTFPVALHMRGLHEAVHSSSLPITITSMEVAFIKEETEGQITLIYLRPHRW